MIHPQKTGLAVAVLGVVCALSLPAAVRAEFLFANTVNGTTTGGFIVPATSLNADRTSWDVLYSPYNGLNYPDIRAPYGVKQTASAAGFTAPANSSPGNPTAFFDTRNATLTQTLEPDAFIIDAGASGNIYSFSGPTAYRLDNSTTNYAAPYDFGAVAFQFQTAGTLLDFATLQLQYTDAGNVVRTLAPAELLREYRGTTGSSFGGITNRAAAQWNLSGLGVRAYRIVFNAAGSSNSFQLATLATSAQAGEIVPTSRVWSTGGSGNWTGGFSDPQGTPGRSPNANGNVRFANLAAASTVLDANYTVGEIRFDTPAAVGVNSSGGFTLTANTGITNTAAATGIYTLSVGYQLGAYNIFDLAAGDVRLMGAVSGNNGLEKDGAGSLTLGGSNSFTGTVAVGGGTLTIAGQNTYTGSTQILAGSLVVTAAGSLANTPILVDTGAALTNHGTVAGTVDVKGTLGGAGTFNGAVTFESGSALASAGTYNGGLNINPGATLVVTSGTLVVRGALSNYGTLRLAKGARLDASGATSVYNAGTLDFLSGSLTLPSGYTVNNGAGGRVLTSDLLKVHNTLSRTNSQVTVRCDGYAGHTYQLQKSTTLLGGSYVNVGSPQTVTTDTALDSPLSFTDPTATGPQGFYRVQVDP